MASDRASQQAFLGVSALLFATSAAVTIVWCTSMSAMAKMLMCGGRTMSMAWMRMPGQTWPGAAASFLVMWVVMMVAMMLPSHPARGERVHSSKARIDQLCAIANLEIEVPEPHNRGRDITAWKTPSGRSW